jgi:adenylate kinase
MRLLLVGRPGSGKGTQARAISAHFGIAHISSGDLLRQHVADDTQLGRTIAGIMAAGDLVPDGVVMDVLRKPVEAASKAGGYVLDGFPRTLAQAESAYLVAKEIGAWVQVAMLLDVAREVASARMLDRAEGRSDDQEDVIRHRQDAFDQVTPAMLDYYARRETLIRIDGDRPVAEVGADAIAALEQIRPTLS